MLSDKWITQTDDAVVVGLCRECDRTYGHDEDCRVGSLVLLETDNRLLREYIDTHPSSKVSLEEYDVFAKVRRSLDD